jgi:DNA-binding NarL/FixJ family response regulator
MASVHRLPHTKYWYASYRVGSRQHLRSTKQTVRTKAMAVAIQYEKAVKLADAHSLTEVQARDVLNDILKATASGEQISTPRMDARKVIAYSQDHAAAAKETEKLSHREREALDLVALGFSNKEIAAQLGISLGGVLWHLKHIYLKLHVHSRAGAILKLSPRA